MADWWQVTCPRWALVVGGASSVWDDLKAAEQMLGEPWSGQTVIVNDIGVLWPRPFEHWVSLHPESFQRWARLRRAQFLHQENEPLLWSGPTRWDLEKPLDGIVAAPWHGGSSGLLAVQVALALECDRVVLVGMPMDPTPHFAESQEPHPATWGSALQHRKTWCKYKAMLTSVRSTSGWTRELLGAPTREWLLSSN